MNLRTHLLVFALFVACAAAFVWLTSMSLPSVVASHFEDSGAANGFMPHDFYVRFTLAFVVVLPAAMVGISLHSIGSPNARIKLPNRDYWLSPEHRAGTIEFLRSGVLWFGTMLVAFLCYLHWLVVLANEVRPAQLANSWFIGGVVVFMTTLLICLRAFLDHFRKGTSPIP